MKRTRRLRALSRLTAALLCASLVLGTPHAASAAPPTLDVLILDPTAPGSAGQTGTPPFDADDNPGHDSSATNHIVRTNDVITYDFQFNVNNAPGQRVTLVSVLPQNGGQPVADFTSLPTICRGAGSNISADGQTLTCIVGAVPQGSALDVIATAKVRVTTPNGTQIPPGVTISDPLAGATPVSKSGYWLDQNTPAPVGYDTVSSTQKINLVKSNLPLLGPVTSYTYSGPGGLQGYYVVYPIGMRQGDGGANNQKGLAPAGSPITFTDTLGPPAFNAQLVACNINGVGQTIGKLPYGAFGTPGANASNSVPNSGTFVCSQTGGAGTAITVNVIGANSNGTSFPTSNADGSNLIYLTWVVTGWLRVFIPDDGTNLGPTGTQNNVADKYSGINPAGECGGGVTNPPASCDDPNRLSSNVTLASQGPAPPPSGNGQSAKAFYVNVNEQNFPYYDTAGRPGITSPSQIVTVFKVTNPSNASTGNVDIINNYACDDLTVGTGSGSQAVYPNAYVYPFDGTTGTPYAPNYGGAVRLSTINGGTIPYGSPFVTAVEYGDSTSTCTGPSATGWYASVDIANPANPNYFTKIQRVRVTGTLPHSQTLRVQINLQVQSGLPMGTLLTNFFSDSGQASTGTGPFNSSAQTTGRILNQNISVVKYLFRNTSNGSLFNPNGPYGSGGSIDSTQQFVAYLDTDGQNGTQTAPNVVTCDLIDTTKYNVANFDGTTGPVNPVYGGPVSFATLNGTPPSPIAVEYSTDPVAPGDNCRSGTWAATPPANYTTITKVRATFNLPPVTRLRMFVNLQARALLPTGTVLTNNMVSTLGIAPATLLTSSQSVTVQSEIVSVLKSGPTGAIQAGTQASFTLQGYVQGISAAQSGIIRLTDTLPAGLNYVPGSPVLTPPAPPSTYIPGSGSATPESVTTNASGQTIIVWRIGQATSAPGVYIAMPTIVFKVTPDISLANGTTLTNSVVISDSLTTQTATSAASLTAANAGAFHVAKATTTPAIVLNGPLTWQLQYSNTGSTAATSTDFIDELPWNGDPFGSNFHGTIQLAGTPTGSFGETFRYTKAVPAQINEDPGCTSNGGAIPPGSGSCQNYPVTAWCPAFSGGSCPASFAEVTAIRIVGGTLPAGSGTRTVTYSANTNGNQWNDQYFNSFGARTNIISLGVQSNSVETVVPVPPLPNLTLVKSCTASSGLACPGQPQPPNADITYTIRLTNTGGNPAATIVVTDPIPPMDFKLGSMAYAMPAGITMTFTYSSDGISYVYTPVSGGGGAPAGYDRNVKAVRWTVASGQLSNASGANTGTVSFTARIR